MAFQALEFDRVLALVSSFARSERGRTEVLATLPRFSGGEGSPHFRLAAEVETLIARHGALGFAGLDAADLLSDSGAAEAADLVRLIGLARRIVEVRHALLAGDVGPVLTDLAATLPGLEALVAFCEQRLGDDGEVLDSASPRLAQARAGRERHRVAIIAALEQLRRQIRAVEAPYTVRRDRYCLPVPAGERAGVPGLVLDVSASAATVFIEPFAVVDLNNALAESIALAMAEEERVLAEVAAAFARQRDALLDAVATLARLDAAQARILFGQAAGATLLEPGAGRRLALHGARHPLLDPVLAGLRADVLGESGNTRPVVPLEIEIGEDTRLILLSGPNAGGKTVALKTIGLAALMAASGIPVLAEAGSSMPPLTRVWCHIGDEQSLLSDLSTFTGAMHATASLLVDADAVTLVLYDELGSGTDPEEGAALAAALLEELARRRCWTIATAHLITVAAHIERLPGAVNAAMGFEETSERPTYRLQLGVPGRSRGLAIAASCGVAPGVVARARELVSASFLAIDTYLAGLQTERDRLIARQDSLDREAGALAEERHLAECERGRLETERDRVHQSLDEERDRLRRRAREQLETALGELQAARERGEMPGTKRLITIRHAALDLGEPAGAALPADPAELAPGTQVRVTGGLTGVVRRITGKRVEVQVGDKRLWVERASLQAMAPGTRIAVVEARIAADEEPDAELKLLGMSAEEAREALERFVDHAMLSGISRLRVVHGHGTGVLRRTVREYFAHHPAVVRVGHPPQYRGGTGVTEVELQ